MIVCHDALVLTIRYVCERLDEAQILGIGAATPVLDVSITQLVREPDRSWRLARSTDVRHLGAADIPITRHGSGSNVHPGA